MLKNILEVVKTHVDHRIEELGTHFNAQQNQCMLQIQTLIDAMNGMRDQFLQNRTPQPQVVVEPNTNSIRASAPQQPLHVPAVPIAPANNYNREYKQ